MNELAISTLQNEIKVLRRAHGISRTPEIKLELHEDVLRLQQAIELLKNPPMWNDEDMINSYDGGFDDASEYGEQFAKGWLENYRKQKESKNG